MASAPREREQLPVGVAYRQLPVGLEVRSARRASGPGERALERVQSGCVAELELDLGAGRARCRGRARRRCSATSSGRRGGGSRRPRGTPRRAVAPVLPGRARRGRRRRRWRRRRPSGARGRRTCRRGRRRAGSSRDCASRSSRSSGSVTMLTPWPSRASFPVLARPVGIELDPEAVGVAQVQRLGDAVVGGALERPARRGDAAHAVGERGAAGVQPGDVVEAGGARRQRRGRFDAR